MELTVEEMHHTVFALDEAITLLQVGSEAHAEDEQVTLHCIAVLVAVQTKLIDALHEDPREHEHGREEGG